MKKYLIIAIVVFILAYVVWVLFPIKYSPFHKQCTFNGIIVYMRITDPNATPIPDGSEPIFDDKGNIIGGCGGWTGGCIVRSEQSTSWPICEPD